MGLAKLFKRKVVEVPSEKPETIKDFFTTKKPQVEIGDVVHVRARADKVTNAELRDLRELLRQRYAADLEIWGYRKVAVHNRPQVEQKMKKADALLLRIKALVLSMDHRDHFSSDAEWETFGEIKERVLAKGKRNWVANPPFGES
jgi:hypothetical protein